MWKYLVKDLKVRMQAMSKSESFAASDLNMPSEYAAFTNTFKPYPCPSTSRGTAFRAPVIVGRRMQTQQIKRAASNKRGNADLKFLLSRDLGFIRRGMLSITAKKPMIVTGNILMSERIVEESKSSMY